MLLLIMLLPSMPPLLSSCCFLPFCPSPYHSPDPYQEEKETPMESLMPTLRLLFRLLFLTTYCLLMLPILEKPSMLLVLVMIYWLTGEILLLIFFSSKDVQFARVILLRTRIVQDIQVKTLIVKFIPSRYFIFISIVIVKEWLLYFSLCLIGRGEILHRPFLCTNLLG